MTIQERLKRSNLIMLIVPIAIAGVLLVAGLGILVFLMESVYLPRLGLTVVKRSIQQMGGSVRAENAPGGGLRIILMLRAVKEQ